MCGSCKIVSISWPLFATLVISRNVLTQKYTLKVEFKNIFFRTLNFCRFMHSLRENENISMWGKRIAPQQNKLLLFLPGSLLNSFLNGRRYIWPTSLNVFGESSSRFKLVLNAYGCFIESDEHNEGHKITKRLINRWDFLEARFDCEMFDSSIYYFFSILRKVRYVFSKEWARSCVCKASNQHFVQACRCNRCVTLRVPYDRVYS